MPVGECSENNVQLPVHVTVLRTFNVTVTNWADCKDPSTTISFGDRHWKGSPDYVGTAGSILQALAGYNEWLHCAHVPTCRYLKGASGRGKTVYTEVGLRRGQVAAEFGPVEAFYESYHQWHCTAVQGLRPVQKDHCKSGRATCAHLRQAGVLQTSQSKPYWAADWLVPQYHGIGS